MGNGNYAKVDVAELVGNKKTLPTLQKIRYIRQSVVLTAP